MNSTHAKTPDGERTRLTELNIGDEPETQPQSSPGLWSRLRACYHNLNLIMAGMYTGLTCYGTPNQEHSYRDDKDDPDQAASKKPDSRPM